VTYCAESGSLRRAPVAYPWFLECDLLGRVLWMSHRTSVALRQPERLFDVIVHCEPSPTSPVGEAGLCRFWRLWQSRESVLIGVEAAPAAAVETSELVVIQRQLTAHFLQLLAWERRIFDAALWRKDQPLRVVLIGTDFEVRVWERLLDIPMGKLTTYSDLAARAGAPKAARAVGAAVGKNPICFVVPCHRVIGKSGELTGYHWGITRKRAMLGWEAGMSAAA